MFGASGIERIEVVNSVQRRHRWSLDTKIRAVEKSSVPRMTVSFVTRKCCFISAQSQSTFRDVVDQLPCFIGEIYNAEHVHSALGYLGTAEYEERHARLAI